MTQSQGLRNQEAQNPGYISVQNALMPHLRDVMAVTTLPPQKRLIQISKLITQDLKVDVCSIYLLRAESILELIATQGLNETAINVTRLRLGEGVVGDVAKNNEPVILAEIGAHPKYKYKPETGEDDIRGGVIAVPIPRDNRVLGVLIVQKKEKCLFDQSVLGSLQTIAMLVAEIVSNYDTFSNPKADIDIAQPILSQQLMGIPIHHGLAHGKIVVHDQKVPIANLYCNDPALELVRFEKALLVVHEELSNLYAQTSKDITGEQAHVLEVLQLFSKDKGWINQIRQSINKGFSAESSATKTLNNLRQKLKDSKDLYMRDRLWDFQDLTNRLLKQLTGNSSKQHLTSLDGIILAATTMGPAELLEYQKYDVRAVLLEEGLQTAHVSIIAKTMNIPMIGRIPDLMMRVQPGDDALVDGRAGKITLHPNSIALGEFQHEMKLKEQKLSQARQAQSSPSVTADGQTVNLQLNAGVLSDLDDFQNLRLDGVGLYRTEIPFMMETTFPDVAFQTNLYRELYGRVGTAPIVFRTLDIGGDKLLPYLKPIPEDNPMMGWRAIRIGLDRPMILRDQMRALIRASQGRTLHIMFPMVTELEEFLKCRTILDMELDREKEKNNLMPLDVKIGVMLEVPSLVHRLEHLLPLVDFLSVGTNDLFQFFYASDRGNPNLSNKYDTLSPTFLSYLKEIRDLAHKFHTPISVCGEMASHPLDALALLGIGYDGLSMVSSAVGPMKLMLKHLYLNSFREFMAYLLKMTKRSIREDVRAYAVDYGILI